MNEKLKIFKRKIAVILIIIIIFITPLSIPVRAAETPSVPETPQAAEIPQPINTDTSQAPVLDSPSVPETPQSTENSSSTENITNTDTTIHPQENTPLTQEESIQQETTDLTPISSDTLNTNNPPPPSEGQTGYMSEGGNVGNTVIETGDANTTGTINNTGNLNSTPSQNDTNYSSMPFVTISNTDNGSTSTNNGFALIDTNSSTVQDNNADIGNSLILDSNSGNNLASKNVGDSMIITGDANVSGTITNFANTNTDGATVAEFNVMDNQTSDLVLDFAANCISGCSNTIDSLEIANTGNGSESTNSGEINIESDNSTTQINDAIVENQMILTANSGQNTANNNTAGNSTIETGDANVAAQILNFLNNNLAGNVILGVVNIFGNLVGDIIIPENYSAGIPVNNTAISNTQNGSDTTNTSEINIENGSEISQINNAQILNNVEFAATTGDNQTTDNTKGNNSITTGNTSIDAQIINFVNNNIITGNWWIVLVNEAGNWVGKIISLPGSTQTENFAASEGTAVAFTDNGTIEVSNNNNGEGSVNTGIIDQTTNTTVTQLNNTDITNNIQLSANTGANSASKNTGGNNTIKTGDANIQLNLINFINNNISSGGKVLVTIINVFGNWMGDIVTPGAKKEESKDQIADNSQNEIDDNNQIASINSNNSTDTNNNQNTSSTKKIQTQSSNAQNNDGNSTINVVSNTINKIKSNNPINGFVNEVSHSVSVAGIKTEKNGTLNIPLEVKTASNNKTNAEKRTIKINLAWLLVIIPASIILIITKRLTTEILLKQNFTGRR